ncbi:MAG: 3-dehydroquinate synthase [Bacteroidia bacterium]|nr:3-dehydroquinate synthase [Bacteroidia bacterium]
MKKIETPDFSIFIDTQLTSSVKKIINLSLYSSGYIVCDENSFAYCLPVLLDAMPELNNAYVIQLPAGEKNKTLTTVQFIWKMLLQKGANRKSLVINLGGGTVTDIGAFAASTFMRGIDFIQIPTTLLSMVDASVGGKTGIDYQGLKNIIGTFAKPKTIIICDQFLKTLPERELNSGFAEMLKHALIADEKHLKELITITPNQVNLALIIKSIKIKYHIVSKDFNEQAERKLLNFGHTAGHAIESYLLKKSKNPLLHGEAVFVGMLIESFLSLQMGLLNEVLFKQTEKHLLSYIPKKAIKEKEIKQIIQLMYHDKKSVGNNLNFSLLKGIGKGAFNQNPSKEQIREAFIYYLSL